MTRRPDAVGTAPRALGSPAPEQSRPTGTEEAPGDPLNASQVHEAGPPPSLQGTPANAPYQRDEFGVPPRHGVPDALSPLHSAFSGRSNLDPARLPPPIRALLASPSPELRSTVEDWVSRLVS